MKTVIRKSTAVALVLALAALTQAATNIFWYKAVERGYSLEQSNPGPGIPAGAVIHQGMLATGAVAQHSGASNAGWACGSGLDDQQGRCAFVWSKELCDATGTITSAKFRGEHQDGWCGNALNNSGSINIRCGVVDFQGNLDTWGSADLVPETADWQDFLNPLSSSMGYDFMTPTLQQEEVISFTAPAGRPDEFAGSVLDGQFLEVDITDQVNWILQNSGHFAIAFLVPPNEGNTGKINIYADESASGVSTCPSDNPWATDCNSAHLWIEGDITAGIEKGPQLSMSRISLSQNTPNPFSASTNIDYNLGRAQTGSIQIFNASGQLVKNASVSGNGSFIWNAKGLTPGIYLCRLAAGKKVLSKRMILMK
jgi:hypothetical protein